MIVYYTQIGSLKSQIVKKEFRTLQTLGTFLNDVSCDFIGSDNNAPVQVNPNDKEYAWVHPIQIQNCESVDFPILQINRIDNDNGTVFSDGKFTDNKKFCAKFVAKWLETINKKINKSFIFTEASDTAYVEAI